MNDHDAIVKLNANVEELTRDVRLLEGQVEALCTALNRYKGFTGGVMLTLSLISTALFLVFGFIKAKVLG